MQIIGHGSLYTYPQNLYPFKFFKLNREAWLPWQRNRKKLNISFHTVFFSPKNDIVWEIIEYMICIVSNNIKVSFISG